MSHLYTARYLLPISDPPIEDGALYIRDGRIAAVGRRAEVRALAGAVPVTDFGDAFLLPPLVNAHTHLELTDFPAWAQALGETTSPDRFVDWILQMVRVKRSVAAEAFTLSLAEGLRRSLTAGTGAVGDILSVLAARGAYRGTPLLGRAFLEVLGRPSGQWQAQLAAAENVFDGAGEGPLRFGLAPHSLYTLAAEGFQATLACARRRGMPLSLHLAEAPAEKEFFASATGPFIEDFFPTVGWQDQVPPAAGCSPLTYLATLGGLQPEVLLVHGVQLSPPDVRAVAERGLSVVLCPRSNARLGVGKAPLAEYLAVGVNLAFGTDSLASCETLSIWDEIAFARRWFGSELPPEKALAMATAGGARALRLEDELGTLQAGLGAHFQVLAPAGPFPAADLYGYLTSGCGEELRHLFLGGEDVLPKDA